MKIKFYIFFGGGGVGGSGGREDNPPKMSFFLGNAMTIKIRKCEFYGRRLLLPWRRLLLSFEPERIFRSPGRSGPQSPKWPFVGKSKNGIFRTLKCTFGVSGFRGSVAGQGVLSLESLAQIDDFLLNFCRKGSIQGPPKIQNSPPPPSL